MKRPIRLPGPLKYGILLLAIAGAYVVTARLGLALALPPERKATAVWPPSGIALAAVLLLGRRAWPGVWIGAFLANLWDYFGQRQGFPLATHFLVSSSIATGSTLQALLGASLLRRGREEGWSLASAREVFRFFVIGLLMCLVAASIGVGTLCLAHFAPWGRFGFIWWTWWIGDTTGVLLVTPLLLAWSRSRSPAPGPRRLAEAATIALVLAGIAWMVFGGIRLWGGGANYFLYLTVPPMVWATYRFELRGAATALVLVSGVAAWGTAAGHGPFLRDTLNGSLLLLQTFMAVLTVTVLTLAGVLEERRRGEEAQARLIDQLRRTRSEARVSELLEEQIHRIARDLHDEAGQLLTSVYLALHEVGRDLPPASRERLREIRTLLDQIEVQLRRLVHELRPTVLNDLGLEPALRFLGEGVTNRTGLAVSIRTTMAGRLPREVESALYRTVQEALRNVVRHAHASCVTVELDRRDGQVRCSILDDGVGLHAGGSTPPEARGLGLTGIRERVSALGGRLEVRSEQGQGSEIEVVIPLETTGL